MFRIVIFLFLLRLFILPPSSLQLAQSVHFVELPFLSPVSPQKMPRGSFEKAESLQKQLNIKLLQHLLLAFHLLSSIFPVFAKPTERASLVQEVDEVAKDVELREVIALALFELEEPMRNIKLE